ncbi:MAG: hybrid sensor histidine kinase/response regulator, partial [Prevotellaceae bacterium]|nr:hybrid sensor histidine kinase/response regulator [Prevotellaceae bacterium]
MKNIMIKLLFVVCCLCSQNILAQNLRFYDSRQLTCNLFTSICQDTEGYIWVGTEYGLNRFNGIQFAHYYNVPEDSASLLHNSVRCLMLDRGGVLWVGFVNGLQYYCPDGNTFCTIQFENDVAPHIVGIVQLKSGEIWVTTSGYGVCRVDVAQKKAYRITDIPHLTDFHYFGYLYEDSEGVQWFGIYNTGLLQYNPATGKSKLHTRNELSGGSVISAILEDNQANLLVATSTTVFRFDRQTDSF